MKSNHPLVHPSRGQSDVQRPGISLAGTEPRSQRRVPVGWPRRVIGLALVLGSLVLGMLAIRSADQRQPVVVAARELTPGVLINAEDLTVEQVHLGSAAPAYASHPEQLVGQVASIAVPAGTLVPVMQERSTLPVVAVAMRTLHLPRLQRGDLVDVWAGSESAPPRLVLRSAVVAEIGPPTGAMSSLSLAIPGEQVPLLIAASESALLSVVRR